MAIFLLFTGLILSVVSGATFINIIKIDYQDIYNKYDKPSCIFVDTTSAHFIGEFIIAGGYKSEISKEHYRYAKLVQYSYLYTLIVGVCALISLFVN